MYVCNVKGKPKVLFWGGAVSLLFRFVSFVLFVFLSFPSSLGIYVVCSSGGGGRGGGGRQALPRCYSRCSCRSRGLGGWVAVGRVAGWLLHVW